MSDLVQIFLALWFMIGITNMVAHIFHCRDCQRQLRGLLNLSLTFIIHCLGWPLDAWDHIRRLKGGVTEDGMVEARIVNDATGKMVVLKRNDGESVESFKKRVMARADAFVAEEQNG